MTTSQPGRDAFIGKVAALTDARLCHPWLRINRSARDAADALGRRSVVRCQGPR
jgi:hypothetical protein